MPITKRKLVAVAVSFGKNDFYFSLDQYPPDWVLGQFGHYTPEIIPGGSKPLEGVWEQVQDIFDPFEFHSKSGNSEIQVTTMNGSLVIFNNARIARFYERSGV